MHETWVRVGKPQEPACVNGVGMPRSFQLKSSGQPGVRAEPAFAGGLALNRAHSPLRVAWTTSRGLTGARGMDGHTRLVTQTIHPTRCAAALGKEAECRHRLDLALL